MKVSVPGRDIDYYMRDRLGKAKNNRRKPRRHQLSEIVINVNFVIKLSEAEEEKQSDAVSRQHKHVIGYKRKRRNRGKGADYSRYKIHRGDSGTDRRNIYIGKHSDAESNKVHY